MRKRTKAEGQSLSSAHKEFMLHDHIKRLTIIIMQFTNNKQEIVDMTEDIVVF